MDLPFRPLGEVPLADDLPDTFENNSRVTTSDTIHAPEHCLEVELPFLQLTLPSFKLVPVLTGDASANETASLIDQLWGNPDTLIIISTDLSHFQDGNTARRLDASTCHAVESLDHQGLSPRDACGFVALRGLLLAARNHGLGVRTLALANSGDTTGDHYRVVGYGSWALYEGLSIASSSDRVH